jgi:hypothetical protein
MPFKVIPHTPKKISSNVNAIFKGFVNNISIMLDSLQTKEITFITNSIFGNNNRFFVFGPITVQARAQAFGVILPDIIIMSLTSAFIFSGVSR